MKIVKKKLNDLNIPDYNPRRMSKEQRVKLENSLKSFGYVEPIVWNKKTNNVVGGNQRLLSLISLKEKGVKIYDPETEKQVNIPDEVEVIMVDVSLDEEKSLNVALNKISGEWDYEKLKDVFGTLSFEKELLELTGFEEKEIALLTAETGFDDIPDVDLIGNVKDLADVLIIQLVSSQNRDFIKTFFELPLTKKSIRGEDAERIIKSKMR